MVHNARCGNDETTIPNSLTFCPPFPSFPFYCLPCPSHSPLSSLLPLPALPFISPLFPTDQDPSLKTTDERYDRYECGLRRRKRQRKAYLPAPIPTSDDGDHGGHEEDDFNIDDVPTPFPNAIRSTNHESPTHTWLQTKVPPRRGIHEVTSAPWHAHEVEDEMVCIDLVTCGRFQRAMY